MLKFVVYLMAGGALAGMAVIAALVLGFDDSTGVITAAAIGAHQGDESYLPLAEAIHPHFSEECILPDFSIIDLAGDEAPVNMLVLEELADRADRGMDPLVGMEAVYEVAKSTLPDFRRMMVESTNSTGA